MDSLYAEVRRSMALEEIIRDTIRAGGPIPFARFMDLALYHPTFGYYRANAAPMTRSGDFLTAPETHPLFGALLARFARAAHKAMGLEEAVVVEQGAGTGELARTFVSYWRAVYPEMPLRYVIVEPHSGTREALDSHLDGVILAASFSEFSPFEGVYLSNELPDAYPVHRVRRRERELVEVFVGLLGDRLVEVEGPPSTPELAQEIEDAGLRLDEGHEIEVNLGLQPWITRVASEMSRGYVLTIDYGYEADEIARFPRGTLLAHYRHAANEDYLERIGRQDLTAHVCWTALARHGGAAGLQTLEKIRQREFLTRWGWKDYGRWLLAHPSASHERLDAVDRLGRIEDGLGGLGVLLQVKGGLAPPDPVEAGPPVWHSV